MSREPEEITIIAELKKNCLEKLRANAKKTHWKKTPNKELLWLLKLEVAELEECIDENLIDNVWSEAGDVANFAAMIADNIKRAQPKRRPDKDGILPLTEEELEEFGKILRIGDILGVRIKGCTLENKRYPDYWQEFPNNYKASLWLAKRFNLEV